MKDQVNEFIVFPILAAEPGKSPDFSKYNGLPKCSKRNIFQYLANMSIDYLKMLHEKGFQFECNCICNCMDLTRNEENMESRFEKIEFICQSLTLQWKNCCDFNNRHPEITELILKSSLIPQSERFVRCCRYNRWPIAKELLDDGVNVNYVDTTHGSTALMHAAQQGHLDIVEKLLDLGADMTIRNANNNKKALDFCENPGIEYMKIRDLLRKANGTFDGRTELEVTSFEKFWNNLIKHDAELEIFKKYEDMGIPLMPKKRMIMRACEKNQLDVLKFFHEQKFDFDFEYDFKHNHLNTPLRLASRSGHLEIVQFLTDICNLRKHASFGLVMAAKYGHVDIVKHLLQLDGIDVNSQTFCIQTALHCSISSDIEILRMLLQHEGINLNVRDAVNQTPLFDTSQQDKILHAKLLIEAGADVTLTDENGKTAIDYARSNEMKELLASAATPENPPDDPENAPTHEPVEVTRVQDNIFIMNFGDKKYVAMPESGKLISIE